MFNFNSIQFQFQFQSQVMTLQYLSPGTKKMTKRPLKLTAVLSYKEDAKLMTC